MMTIQEYYDEVVNNGQEKLYEFAINAVKDTIIREIGIKQKEKIQAYRLGIIRIPPDKLEEELSIYVPVGELCIIEEGCKRAKVELEAAGYDAILLMVYARKNLNTFNLYCRVGMGPGTDYQWKVPDSSLSPEYLRFINSPQIG